MADYSIPLSGEDSGMLSTIKTSLDSLSSSTETKKANKSVLLGKFQEELSSEVATLKENILNITQVCYKDTKLISFQIQEIESPALLDPESAYEEIKQTLERLEKSIEQVRSSIFFLLFLHPQCIQVRQKAFQFEKYEEKFEFPAHEYPEIDEV